MSEKELQHYFSHDLKWGWFRQFESKLTFAFLLDAAKFCENGVILDAGAGHQRYKPFFSRSIYLSQEHHAGIKIKGMKNIEYDLIYPLDKKIPLKDKCLDAVLSTSVIEHLQYPDKFCAEANRVLKPGGKLFINVPFVNFEHEIPYDYNRLTRYGLKRMLKDAGFANISVVPTSSSVQTLCGYFPFAIYMDILKSDKSPRQYYHDIRKTTRGIKLYVRFLVICFAFAMFGLAKLYYSIIRVLFDRGPYSIVGLPSGWIAVATKSGKLNKKPLFQSKEAFLKRNILAK